jgi:hypothetical protein
MVALHEGENHLPRPWRENRSYADPPPSLPVEVLKVKVTWRSLKVLAHQLHDDQRTFLGSLITCQERSCGSVFRWP